MLMGERSFRDFIKAASYSFHVGVAALTVTVEKEYREAPRWIADV